MTSSADHQPIHPSGGQISLGFDPLSLSERLRAGSAALFPTDTVPALAARPEFAQQLWALKHRPSTKPMILMAAEPDPLFAALGLDVRDDWRAMAVSWWPGALTLVLPARGPLVAQLHPGAEPGGTSLGLRIPACEPALELLRLTGPLATTSANRSGEPACLSAAEAALTFPDLPLLAPLPWPTPGGAASTVLAWTATGEWRVLRAGAVCLQIVCPESLMLWLGVTEVVLMSLSHVLLEPLLVWGTPLFELRGSFWIALVVLGFLLAGRKA